MCLISLVTEAGGVASESWLPNHGGNVTRQSVREYLEAVRPRYRAAHKAERGRILDEVCRTTGYHRKSAVRLLRGRATGRSSSQQPHGRPRSYGSEVGAALRDVWEASDRLCSKRLAPFLAEFVASLERHGRLALPAEVREKLVGLSPATIDRLLAPGRPKGRRPYTQGTASSRLKAQIPLRTFGDWADVPPGALQADLVAHCGESTDGFYLTTLNAVDVATGWTECQAIWGKGQERVGAGLHHIRRRLPFAWRELHTDNGSEFLNSVVYPWCTKHGIRLTRGR